MDKNVEKFRKRYKIRIFGFVNLILYPVALCLIAKVYPNLKLPENEIILYLIFFFPFIVLAVVGILYRCPHCGDFLPIREICPYRCRNCDKILDPENKPFTD